MCRRGRGVVQRLFEQIDNEKLQGLVIWLPMLPGDDAAAARAQSRLVQDERVVTGWDPERRLGALFAPMLGLSCPAWDVYLLYPAGARWGGSEPPRPAFWMHQLPEAVGAESRLLLDAERLAAELQRLLGDTPAS